MQRNANRQSPGPCADSKRLVRWIKDRGICAACGDDGGVIAHHFAGSSAKVRVGVERAMIGHFAVNGLCLSCDNIVTHGTRLEFRKTFGNECEIWAKQVAEYPGHIPEIIKQGIQAWAK